MTRDAWLSRRAIASVCSSGRGASWSMTVDRDGECLLLYPLNDWEQVETAAHGAAEPARTSHDACSGSWSDTPRTFPRRPRSNAADAGAARICRSGAARDADRTGQSLRTCGTRPAGWIGAIAWLKSEAATDRSPSATRFAVAVERRLGDCGEVGSWMSTRRCLSTRCLRLWRCVRPASTSMPPSVAAATARASSRRSAPRAVSSRSIATRQAIAAGRVRFAHEPRLHLVHGEFGELAALVRAQGLASTAMASCSISASPRRSWTIQRAASASSRTVRSICAWTRRAANQFPHGSRGRAAMRCAT